MAGTPSSSVPSSAAVAALAYVEITANVTISGTSSATANTIMTLPGFTADGTSSYILEVYGPALTNGAAGNLVIERWLDGVAEAILANPVSGIGSIPLFYRSPPLVPAAGARVYSIRGWRATANGTFTCGTGTAGAFEKAWARVIAA